MVRASLVIHQKDHDAEKVEGLRRIGCVIQNGIDSVTLEVVLPKGWHYVADDAVLGPCIYDLKNQCRITVAGDPQSGYSNPVLLVPLARYWGNIEGPQTERVLYGIVFDLTQGLDQPIYKSEEYPFFGEMDGRTETNWREQYAAAGNDAIAWLDKHYPEWRNPTAYWD